MVYQHFFDVHLIYPVYGKNKYKYFIQEKKIKIFINDIWWPLTSAEEGDDV